MGTEHRDSGQMTNVHGTSKCCLIECQQFKALTDTGSRGGAATLSPGAQRYRSHLLCVGPTSRPSAQGIGKADLEVNSLENPKLGRQGTTI